MSQLSNAVNNLLCIYEDSDIEITLLSFLILEFHVSTNEHKINNEVLIKEYGISNEQLEICYNELEYYGYVKLKYDYMQFTDKSKQLFIKKSIRLSTDERVRLEKDFEKFWKLYPVRVGKKKAKFEWMKLRPNKSLTAKIIKAVPVQIEWKKQEERKGIFVPQFPHAERWIKHERYTDECIINQSFININNKSERDER